MLTFKEKLLCKVLGKLMFDPQKLEFTECRWNDVVFWICRKIEPDFNKVVELIDKMISNEIQIRLKRG